MHSTNDTGFLSVLGRFYLRRDGRRITLAGATGNYNFQFYVDSPIDGWIPDGTELSVGLVKLQRRIADRLYGGVSYVHLDFETSTEVAPGVEEDSRAGPGSPPRPSVQRLLSEGRIRNHPQVLHLSLQLWKRGFVHQDRVRIQSLLECSGRS